MTTIDFMTRMGSTYEFVAGDKSKTIRTKAHKVSGDNGKKTASDLTVYGKWSEIKATVDFYAAKGYRPKRWIVVTRSSGNMELCGYDDVTGEEIKMADVVAEPELDLCPIELFASGHLIHFGNNIISVNVWRRGKTIESEERQVM